ncbi:MAG TPA: tRNA (adenosine(37)-N6)-threonylcarbamoyltransferase complex dimerization subunit type 1 TsaB [Anaeromyxobacteraceae bacterium]|nr:tRNA (adenosine(37)-N6)-threonylcarbamoyltransferase complex dimerization subunit type 1 TsaB [Anaeromyxobacteraceae bacterium]
MLVAALDTATLTLSCALVEVEPGRCTLVAERLEHTSMSGGRPAPPNPRVAPGRAPPPAPSLRAGGSVGGHSTRLPSALTDLLVACGKSLPDVEGYAIGIGPGSFTGLRIGLATWKGLAYANRRPIAGASSLAAMALAAAPDAGPGAVLVPLLDAKKGEVYAGFYRATSGGVEAIAPEAALAPAALVERVRGWPDAVAFGAGYGAYPDVFGAGLPQLRTEVASPPALAVARLAAPRLAGAAYDAQALFALEPHYVRPSEAELKYPRGLGPGAEK